MKRKSLLPISLMCLFGITIVGCNSKKTSSSSEEPASISSSEPAPSSTAPSSSSQAPSTSEAPAPVAVTGVSLDVTTASILKGTTKTLVATVAPADATNKVVTWSSDDEDVATVDANGVVTAVEAGLCTITAKTQDGNFTAVCDVDVYKDIEAVTINNKSQFADEGFTVDDTLELSVSVNPEDNISALLNAGVLKVTSSDESIATVSGLMVQGKKAGTVTITVELFGKTDSFEVTVEDPIPGEPYSIDNAFKKAATEESAACTGSSTGSTIGVSTTCFKFEKALVLAVAPDFDSKSKTYSDTGFVVLIDDGTNAVYLQVSKTATEEIPVEVGDYVSVTCKLSNYYGLFEGVSRKAKKGVRCPYIPLKDFEKIDAPETPITPSLATPTAMSASEYEAYYALCKTNGTKNSTTYTDIKYVSLNVTYDKNRDETTDRGGYIIDGAKDGTTALAIQNLGTPETTFKMHDPADGNKSTLNIYLIGANTSKFKSNGFVVAQEALAVTSIAIEQEAQTIVHGNQLPLTIKTQPEGAYLPGATLTWSSDNEEAGTVGDDGVFNALYTVQQEGVDPDTKVANVKATLTAGETVIESPEVAYTVFGKDVPVESVDIASTFDIIEGQTKVIAATVVPAMNSDKATWTSSNEAVATVDNKGNVTALKEGTSTITVSYNATASDTCELTVAKLTAATNYVGAEINTTGRLVAKSNNTSKNTGNCLVEDGTGGAFWVFQKTATISPLPGSLVTVTGKTEAYNGGYEVVGTVAQASDAEAPAEAPVTPVTADQISAIYNARTAGNQVHNDVLVPTRKVSLRTGIIGGSGNYLTWSYGTAKMETSYATGDMQPGFMYDVEGYIFNFYLANNAPATDSYLCMCITKADKVDIPVTGITLDRNFLDLAVEGQATLKATRLPAGSDGAITWASSDTAIATVDQNGKVVGVANGTATITATVGTFTDSCKVTVGAVAPINIEKADSIAVGDTVYLACDAVSKQYSGPSAATATAFGNGVEFTTKPDADVYALEVVAGSAENSFAFKIKSGDYKDKYLNWASGNTLSVSETLDANSSWTVTISGENKNALIANVADSAREIWWNVSSPRFASYTGKSDGTGYKATQLWKVVGVTPVDIAQPNGNYSGNAIDLEDHEVFTNIALAGNMANVEVGTLVKTLTTYSYDKATGLVTIVLGGNFGNLTAIYDEANDKLTEVTFHGNAAAMMKNNGTLELTAAANLMTCEGSTAELQATFKRRYGDPWTVDTGNADRFTSVDNGITGKGMKVRAYSGGRYAFCFANDFGSPITVSNVGFWVYNSSNKDVTLRMWYYQGTGLTNNGETGTVTAKAGGWTYCRMGFGSKNIYNFQIADFNKTGVELVFDNICLF